MAKVNLSEDLKSNPRVARNIYINDALFLCTFVILSWMFIASSFDGILKILFLIFTIGVGLWIITKCPVNPTRKNWEALAIYIMRDTSVYKPLSKKDFMSKQESEEFDTAKKKRRKAR